MGARRVDSVVGGTETGDGRGGTALGGVGWEVRVAPARRPIRRAVLARVKVVLARIAVGCWWRRGAADAKEARPSLLRMLPLQLRVLRARAPRRSPSRVLFRKYWPLGPSRPRRTPFPRTAEAPDSQSQQDDRRSTASRNNPRRPYWPASSTARARPRLAVHRSLRWQRRAYPSRRGEPSDRGRYPRGGPCGHGAEDKGDLGLGVGGGEGDRDGGCRKAGKLGGR